MLRSKHFIISIFIGIVVLISLSTEKTFQYHQQLRAEKQLDLLLTNKSPFIWPFDNDKDLFRGRNLENLNFANNQLNASTDVQGEAYFYLNQKGFFIDSRRFNQLKMKLNSGSEGSVVISFYLPFDRVTAISSTPIAIKKGQQNLDIDLTKQTWNIVSINKQYESITTAKWGSYKNSVRRLRLDWQLKPKQKFSIQQINLVSIDHQQNSQLRESLLTTPLTPITLTTTNLNSLFDQLASQPAPQILAIDQIYTPPDYALWAIQKIHSISPSTVVFPTPLDLTQYQIKEHKSYIWQKDSTWVIVSGILYSVILIAFIFVLLRQKLPWINQPTKQQATIEFTILFIIAGLGLLIIPLLYQQNELRYLLVTLIVITGYLLNRQTVNTWQAAGFQFGSRQAWTDTALWSLPSLLLLLVIAIAANSLDIVNPLQLSKDFLKYILWGLIQQFIIGPLFAARIYQASQSIAFSAIATAGLFAFLHFPNFSLMITTLIMGSIWTFLYLKHKTIIPLAVSIGLLGVLYHELAPLYIRFTGDVGALYYAFMYLP